MMACYRAKYPGSYIFSSSKSVPVHWGHFSIVEAELLCLNDLLDNGRNWSYALDMAGSEVMLLTNRELVANLSANLGEIYTESFPLPDDNRGRIEHKFKYDAMRDIIINIGGNSNPPPFNLTIYKGAKAWRSPRKFIEFLLNHPVAQQFTSMI